MLDLITRVQTHALAAKGLTPQLIAEQPADQQSESLQAYRQSMIVLIESLLAMERQIIDSDFEQAYETFQSIRDLQSEGHKQFKKPNED